VGYSHNNKEDRDMDDNEVVNLFESFFSAYSEEEKRLFRNHCELFAKKCVEVATASIKDELNRAKENERIADENFDAQLKESERMAGLMRKNRREVSRLNKELESNKSDAA
jgi:hypothetical protein